jgi:hypothetical protein
MTLACLFVYGTLKPGRSRRPVLEPYVDPTVERKQAMLRVSGMASIATRRCTTVRACRVASLGVR